MFLPYGKQWIVREDLLAVQQVLESDWLTQGPKVEEFEKIVADYVGAAYGVAFSNGTAALHGAMYAAGIKPGKSIVTSPITFAATANAALYTGGKPRFADISQKNLCLDPEKVAAMLEKDTSGEIKGIVPVSYGGYPAPIKEYKKIIGSRDIFIIEDGCHALGAYRENVKVGYEADMTVFSFHPVKHITTGEGGMILTQNAGLAEKLRLFRSHGITKDKEQFQNKSHGPWYHEMQDLGWNYRLTDLQCALGISQMQRLDSFVARRREIARAYREAFTDIPEITCPPTHKGHSWHLYPVQVSPEKRRGLFEHLRHKEIGVQVHYIPVHLHPYYQETFGYSPGDYPKAEHFYSGTLSLPMFPRMKDADVERVVQEIRDFL